MVGGGAPEVAVTPDWRARKRAATRARITTATFALCSIELKYVIEALAIVAHMLDRSLHH